MSEFSNTPIVPPSTAPGLAGWFRVWMKAVTKPNEQTFIDITEHPDAQPKTAYIWIFLVGTLSTIVTGLIQAILVAAGVSSQLGVQGAGSSVGVSIFATICASPIAGGISVLFFALGIAIVQWIAKLFGGTGTYDKLVYAVAAISVPFSLVSMFLVPLNVVPYLNICTGLISFGLSIYVIYLQITAVKAVHGFGWLEAAIAVFLPVILLVFLCAFAVLGIMKAVGPSLNNILQQLQPSL